MSSIEMCKQQFCIAAHAGSHFEAHLRLQVLLTKNQLPDGSHDLPLSYETGPSSFETGSVATDSALHHRHGIFCCPPVRASCLLDMYRDFP